MEPSGHGVALAGVTLRDGPWADPVADSLDLEIPEGDHLAVVGPSGVRKSTLAGLVTGVLVPQPGSVLGGVSVAGVDPVTLARQRVLIPE